MCGIAGIFNRGGAPVNIDVLVRMTRTLDHRGPDEEGYFVNRTVTEGRRVGVAAIRGVPGVRQGVGGSGGQGNVGLGHRRLSIIDLESGQQPLSNEDGAIWVAFNGEIYNFAYLKKELETAGHVFRTHSDTEVIVHAYEEWGCEAVSRFRGMFAIALWDEPTQTLWLARDRVGKKPLYYALVGDQFVFASEIKALLEVPRLPRAIDATALSDYLSLMYVPSPKSIFKSIRKLPPGNFAVVRQGDFRVTEYWDLKFDVQRGRSEKQVAEELLGILEESVRLRMISDVPLGAFLSGGVDSSAVVGLMARQSTQPVITNSVAFGEASYDEAHYAKQVAALFKTDHHEFEVTPHAVPVVGQLAWHYDEPFADSSAVPTYYVSRTARTNVTVSLSGDGGDENFAGYRRYYFDARENTVRDVVPEFARARLFRTIGRLYPKADFLPRVFRGKAFLSNVARDPVEAYFFSMSAFKQEEKNRLLDPDICAELEGYRTVDLFRSWYSKAEAPDHLSKIQYVDVKTYLPDDILTKVDRASMAVSLEVRCPILDHVFMEYVATIPSRMKLVGRDGKHVFKRALSSLLPESILSRRKMGFGVPIAEWFRGELSDYAAAVVAESEASHGLFRSKTLERMWSEHQRGVRNWATELWGIVMFNAWHKRFMCGGGRASNNTGISENNVQ